MNRYDMQDLIIDEDNHRGKKPRRVLAIIALVIIILIAGMTIMRSVVGGGDENSSKETATESETVDKELQPVDNPIKVKKRADDETPDELKPISDDELPTIPLPAPKVEKTEQTANIVKEKREEKPSAPVEEPKPKEQSKPAVKKESTPVHKAPKNTHENKKVVKKENKTVKKPSELFKKAPSGSKSKSNNGKIYYIQIGSFSKTPNHKYFDNIKSKGYSYKLFKSGNLVKVRVGPYTNYNEAKGKLPDIKSSLGVSGFVVKVK